jgi:hypothetical protein
LARRFPRATLILADVALTDLPRPHDRAAVTRLDLHETVQR